MATKTQLKRILEYDSSGKPTKYDAISLWQKDAMKIHAHALQDSDPIVNTNTESGIETCGYGYAYIPCGDNIIGIASDIYVLHKPFEPSVKTKINFNGQWPHLASNYEDEILGCIWGSNKVFHYYIDDDNNIKTELLNPADGESEFIGVNYVNGLWVLISTTNIYYSTDISKGFNSIKYTSSAKVFQTIRQTQTTVCRYGDYYYICGTTIYKNILRIQINAGNNTITKVYTEINEDYSGAIATIPMTTADDIGTSPVVITMRSNHYLTVYRGNSPQDMDDYDGFETNIYCSKLGQAVGFECAPGKLALLYNCDGSQKVYTIIIDFNSKTVINTGSDYTLYNGAELYSFDNGEYFGAYGLVSGKPGTSIFSSYNGIEWNHNWGYIYTENTDRTHHIVTSVVSYLNTNTHCANDGVYIGTGESYNVTIPIDFTPRLILIASNKVVDNSITSEEHNIVFEDRHGEIWNIKYYDNVDDSQAAYSDTKQYFIFNIEAGVSNIYNIWSSQGYVPCSWNGSQIVLDMETHETILKRYNRTVDDYPNVKNRVYKWWAMR